jgi:hypothetical protein
LPAKWSVYALSRKQKGSVYLYVMISSLADDKDKLLKMWSNMDSDHESRDYDALYAQCKPAIESLIQAVMARASKPCNALHECQTIEEFWMIFGCICKCYMDALRKREDVDRRNFGLSTIFLQLCMMLFVV